ncbi:MULTISPECIES: tRNA uridine-5-carboxymethylaminomethyl(34) synthesis enzyme MnmG [Psychrilyobacter]|uniref:tRNA uridine 5-carboxymethylaminomethyl modification enzyme MnmG n=1 Tax=Psychrilyobacter piezotolerans TaxID=2293438 RepID=A0ABX9KEX3_9FUSO|nr:MULTISPECIES: tRNA uridine-5-carboxymethylaminomethyl(34) synthesis enzyme MnmG [Psychrilyobacter]MCS5421600.1 tRNA uridine-5-carboxymethylaminomethyl(34) synthesis enzyme MnmG [Psychrilyobacter sp. S5]NDI78172.1 tRNA uridine-5-carboxymethylaminomethyl(34) synthesis enzyme MnmG [Psychrilyobacter piezotolerans]RDE60136.1 tRNA uridine-5-carboxymethylaminomethyl(34) synthesis enzyme MnmG [Psychrilyobacter sp. S5]REI40318.1 tRNA uridine-5-carboxymethylaminomethyl(34) synthesis enzyme MnmG [Psych
MHKFDVIVVGAGHAGCEAALASARMGMKTAIFSITLDNIGVMSCNPSIGGPAKSHLVKEIDALGGEMGRNIDKTFVQIRVLNTKKGPAVRSLRAQADKQSYHMEMKKTIENTENLDSIQGMVTELLVEGNKVIGIKTQEGVTYSSKTVIIAAGTFMRGLIHIGDKKFQGGRMGELPSNDLPLSLKKIGLELGRFKTGTPPRIDFRSMNFDRLEEQPGNLDQLLKFSSRTLDKDVEGRDQIPCYITYTNPDVHNVITQNKSKSPLFNGTIEGTGPRYCPSIEDKVFRYQEKEKHHLFLEKEGYGTNEVYISGFSTSLPAEVQEKMVKNIYGLEDAKIMRYAYAIEYDYVLPEELQYSLETKKIENLFLAGQINGTSGYEEAAGQGLLAGMNAARKLQGKEPIILDRADSYLGTLVDDLVTKGTNEPYRMFTARSEYRLLLREDNADLRLSQIGYEAGLLDEVTYNLVEKKKRDVLEIIEKLSLSVGSSNKRIEEVLIKKNSGDLKSGTTLLELLKRPRLDYKDIKYIAEIIDGFELGQYPEDTEYQVEVQVKYDGYIKKSLKMIEKHKALEERLIPKDFDYDIVSGITGEAKEKLNEKKPLNIGQASRISGVSPADISVLLMVLKIRGDK